MRGLSKSERAELTFLVHANHDGEVASDAEAELLRGLVASGRAVLRTEDLDDEFEIDVYDASAMGELALRVCPKEEP